MEIESHGLLVIGLKEIVVVSHALDEVIPILRSERVHAEGLPGRVETVPSGRVDSVPVGLLEVHDPRLVVQDGAGAAGVIAVHVIDAVARVEAVVGRHRRADVGDARRPPAVRFIVEHFELVKVRVTEELTRDRRLVPNPSTPNISHHFSHHFSHLFSIISFIIFSFSTNN